MRRCLFAGFLFLATVLPPALSLAQDVPLPDESPYTLSTHERIHVGVRLGGALTQPTPTSGSTLSGATSWGWMVGGMATYKLDRRYQLEAGVAYQQQSSKLKDNPTGSESRMRLNLLTWNASVRRTNLVTRGSGIWSDFYVCFGPSFSYWLNGTNKFTTPAGQTEYDVLFLNETNQTTVGLQVTGVARWLVSADLGAGFSVPIARQQKIFLEVRGSFGLTPLGAETANAFIVSEPSTLPLQVNEVIQQRLNQVWLTASYTVVHNSMKSRLGRSTKEKNVKRRDPRKQKKDKTYLNTRLKSSKK